MVIFSNIEIFESYNKKRFNLKHQLQNKTVSIMKQLIPIPIKITVCFDVISFVVLQVPPQVLKT